MLPLKKNFKSSPFHSLNLVIFVSYMLCTSCITRRDSKNTLFFPQDKESGVRQENVPAGNITPLLKKNSENSGELKTVTKQKEIPTNAFQEDKELAVVSIEHSALNSPTNSASHDAVVAESEDELIENSVHDTLISNAVDDPENADSIDLDDLAEFSDFRGLPIEKLFPLCENSIYINDWTEAFNKKWTEENGSKYKLNSRKQLAMQQARSQAFISLLMPLVDQSEYDYPLVINDDVVKWMTYFQTRGRKNFVTWLKRGETVIPQIQETLARSGLPKDLAYLAMIESGFNNRAVSIARAAGPWQFMRGTAKGYGLKINDFLDERRNLSKSTIAAARYLGDLYDMFGDWFLAAASYNAGEGRVKKAQKKNNKSDFFALSEANNLPQETRNYVPKLMAAMIIAKNPEYFGFEVSKIKTLPKIQTVKVTKPIMLTALAKDLTLTPSELEILNPDLRTHFVPVGYELRVPEPIASENDESASAKNSLNKIVENLPEANHVQNVKSKIKKNESVANIAKRTGLTTKQILAANPTLKENYIVKTGQTVTLPLKLGSGVLDKLSADSHQKRHLKKHASREKSSKKSKKIAKSSKRIRSI